MDAKKSYRATFTLPAELAVGIATVAKRLGVSQSALLAEVLSEPMADLVRLVELMPPPGEAATPETMRRLRGASVELIRQRVQEAQGEASQIETDPKLL